jgi:Glycosyl hydrolases family 43
VRIHAAQPAFSAIVCPSAAELQSACDTGTPDYRMGMLSADEADDLTDPHSWAQHSEPVFRSREELGIFGQGHNCLSTSRDGTEDWFAYHAKATDRYTYKAGPHELNVSSGMPTVIRTSACPCR